MTMQKIDSSGNGGGGGVAMIPLPLHCSSLCCCGIQSISCVFPLSFLLYCLSPRFDLIFSYSLPAVYIAVIYGVYTRPKCHSTSQINDGMKVNEVQKSTGMKSSK
ncbi:unnamed protein product [Cuscuta epithymum]|uniref:Transmembrane protein n=1 Tax=Cuscuta epithymum TaxID=186058 RepID=A0AAV0D3Y9_9ASTE|nr:unnamed protein product [Cuscuta epithymum]